jgi:hypothetical protein
MAIKPLAIAAALAAILTALPSPAAEDSFIQVSALLDAGWKPSSKGLEAAREQYQALATDGKIDPRVTYGYALVQMRNRKYDEAQRLLDDVLAADKNNTAARRAKVWVLMVTQSYSAALVELEALSKLLRMEPPATNADDDDARSVEFLGRVMGFVDGPAASAVAEHVRADYRKRLAGSLTPTQRQVFEEAHTAVARRFAELDLDRQQTKADAKADEEKRRDLIRQQLDRERNSLSQEKTNLSARAEKVEADSARELTDIEAQLRPLAARQSRLESRGAAITREMAGLSAEIGRLLELADLAEDPIEAARWRAEARRLDVALGRYDVDLRALNGELAGVAAQRVTLAGRRQAALAKREAENDRIERRATEVRNTEKRIATDEKKTSQPAAGNTAAVASLAAKARAFSTYEAFPFEEERARLLQSLRE